MKAVKGKLCNQCGFSLVELSIVLVIIGALAGTAIIPLSTSFQQARYKETKLQLQLVREAMHGYLIGEGKLPCPLALNTDEIVVHDDASVCSRSTGGVPAVALGVMGERSKAGALLDGWGRPLRYAVSFSDNQERGDYGLPDWLSAGEPSAIGAEYMEAELQLCRSSVSRNCGKQDLIANQIVWIIYSLGEQDKTDGVQDENQDGDEVFAVSAYSTNPSSPFDDQLVWASRSELVYWLLRANWF